MFMLGVVEDVSFIQDIGIILFAAGVAGWACQKVGFSSVVGYLLAGVFIGPYNSSLELVSNTTRIHELAQIGLIFLMFWIGLGFSIRRIRRVGLQLIITNLIAAFLLFKLFQTSALLIGKTGAETIFLGSLFLISSSAIISKLLQEKGISHEKPSQNALGIVINEDALVVILLTLLTSYAQFESFGVESVSSVVLVLIIFISLMLGLGLVFVPYLLKIFQRKLDSELSLIFISALLIGFALLSIKAGYPLALGAFLLGAIIADTPAKAKIERFLGGTQQLLTTVFFTAIGMMIDLKVLSEIWPYILLFFILTLIFRCFAYSFGLLVIGKSTQEAVRTGLIVTPVGEFSFIIAGLGIQYEKIDPSFYPLAVGVSLLTALVAPFLFGYSEKIGMFAEKHQPEFLRKFLRTYRNLLAQIYEMQHRNSLWNLSKRRLFQITRDFFLISGLLLFAKPLYPYFQKTFGNNILFPYSTPSIFIIALTLLCAPLFLSLWRNIAVLGLVYASAIREDMPYASVVKNVFEKLFYTIISLFIILWIWVLLPLPNLSIVGFVLLAFLLTVWILLFRKKLVYWQSKFEIAFQNATSISGSPHHGKIPQLSDTHLQWNLDIVECQIPDETPHAGLSLSHLGIRNQFGSTIIGLERQGHLISNPDPETLFYPHDRVLILGTPPQIKKTKQFLTQRQESPAPENDFDEIILDHLLVPQDSPRCNKTLASLNLRQRFGILVVGIQRKDQSIIKISATETLQGQDELLVVGSPDQIKQFSHYLLPQEKNGE